MNTTIRCHECQGTGALNGRSCHFCIGLGEALLIGEYVVYWRKDFSRQAIFEEELVATTRSLMRFVFFAITLAGFMSFFIGAVAEIERGVFTPWQIILATGPSALFFWVAIAAGLYIYYSLDRDEDSVEKIPRRIYEKQTPSEASFSDFSRYQKLNTYDTLTPEMRSMLAKSFRLSLRFGHPFSACHLFLLMLRDHNVRTLLMRLGLGSDEIAKKLLNAMSRATSPFFADWRAIFLDAYSRAYEERRVHIDTITVFAALVNLDALIAEVLYDVGIDETKVSNVVIWLHNDEHLRQSWKKWRTRARLRPRKRIDRAMTAVATPILDYFSEDETERAQWGYISPVSRPEFIDPVFRSLQSGRAPLLVGQAGVGKKGVIGEIAERMVANDVPDILQDKRLVSVSVPKLVSGATPAEAEERLLRLLVEVSHAKNIVLVVEEVEGMIGITSGKEGSVDLAGVFARILSDRHYPCIATTTPEAYQAHIAHSALSNVFGRIDMAEPSQNQTIKIVETRVAFIEAKYRVFFSYDSIARLVDLTTKFIPDHYQPQKSLSYLNELALYVKEKYGVNKIILPAYVDQFLSERLEIPLMKVDKDEATKLLHFEDILHKRVIGQSEAVAAVAEALRRTRAALGDQKRPVVNLLFLGPTGVGKTELAKAVAEAYFGGENQMVRFDMSEYRELTSMSRLIGSPDGNQRGLLTAAIRARPFSLLLLDEFEKAHSDIINIFLQVMDDGRLTDSSGQVTDFTNVIIIATSNAGTSFIQEQIRQNKDIATIEKALLNSELQQYFRPELLNRFDRIVVFRPLAIAEVTAIARLMVAHLAKRLSEQGIILNVTDKAISELATLGFDPLFGARPLRRVIQDRVDSLVARQILEGKLHRRDEIILEDANNLRVIKAREL